MSTIPFSGCLKDVKILCQMTPVEKWCPLDWDKATHGGMMVSHWHGCPFSKNTLEVDKNVMHLHFLGRGITSLLGFYHNIKVQMINYLQLFSYPNQTYFILGYARFRSSGYSSQLNSRTVTLVMSLRTEVQNGLLFFIYGASGTYMFAQLLNGALHFEYSNPAVRGHLLFPHDPTNLLCDGEWKSLVFEKSGRQLSIEVDGVDRKIGDRSEKADMELASDIFFGGIPSDSDAERFIQQHGLQINTSEYLPLYFSHILF